MNRADVIEKARELCRAGGGDAGLDQDLRELADDVVEDYLRERIESLTLDNDSLNELNRHLERENRQLRDRLDAFEARGRGSETP